jgi:DNA-binding transcriptional MerR regulator
VTAVKNEWKLGELADAAGVSARTVRYYLQRGLLPGPAFRGKDTVYGEEHLLRLRAIRKLQERFLPLDAIQVELERLGTAELTKIVAAAEVRLPAGPSAPVVPRVPMPDRWERFELAEGVELFVRDEGSARRFARRLLEKAAALPGDQDAGEGDDHG